MTPGMVARRGPEAIAADISPPAVKFDFWRSMVDLAALVMRSGAPGLTWRVSASLVLVFIGKLAGVAAPVALGDAINRLAPGGGQAVSLGFDFLMLALAFVGLRFVAAFAPNLREMIFTVVSQSTMAKAATETFAHALALGLDYHQGKQTGSLSRVIDRGARSTDFLMRSVVFNLGPTAVELVMAMAVMAMRLDWRFAVTAFVTIVLYAVITFRITDWRLSHRRELNEADSRTAGLSVDALLNYETVKTFGTEERTVGRYEDAMADYVRASVRSNSSLAMLNAVQALVLNLGLALMTIMAGYEVLNGRMRIGDVTMAILLLIGIYGPLNMLGFNYREIRQAFIDMEQMVQLKAVKPDIVDAPDARPLPPATGQGAEIVFRDVEFRHDARSTGLIDVSFRAAPGATVALVGPSGAGKTTAVRLALRLIDPQSGAITLDGVDLRKVAQADLRRAVALVPQDVALFNDTLAANIAFARPGASAAEVRAAADAAEVLRRGRIVEQGRHDDLLEKGGEYAALWRRQTRAA